MRRAKAIEKMMSAVSGETMPTSAPMAIPVNAPWPSESEKNAMRLETTMVERSPKSGVMRRTARRAFFIKVYSVHEKGRSVSMM